MEDAQISRIMDKINKNKFESILDAWESVFHDKDFFTDAIFVCTETNTTKTCKSKRGILEFSDSYLNLNSQSKGHLLFHFRFGGDGSINQFYTLQLSHDDDDVSICVEDIRYKPPVRLEQFFSCSGKESFYEEFQHFLERIKEAEEEFNKNK